MEEFIFKSNPNYEHNALVAPNTRTQTIPVLLDAVKQLDEFDMTRFTFFIINSTASVEDWITLLRAKAVPFLLFGITAVVYRPNRRTTRFLSSETIDHMFHQIEEVDGLVVDSEHIWLPNFLLKLNNRDLSSIDEQPYLQRGAVWRVNLNLFQIALIFQRELINIEEFSKRCQNLEQRMQTMLNYSPEETEAFRAWSTQQITDAIENYTRQRGDPKRGVLEWVDDEGNRRPG
jgi:hypothetical protein